MICLKINRGIFLRYRVFNSLAGCLLFLSCNTKNETVAQTAFTGMQGNEDISGIWELREAQYGMMPNKPFPPGNGTRLHFTLTTFEQYRENKLIRSGSYLLMADTTASATVGLQLPAGQFNRRIIFNQDTTEKTFIDLRGDSLTLVSGFFPVDAGAQQVFVRTGSKP